MLHTLKIVLDIQELDMKMIRLMRLKKERLKELEHIDSLRQELTKLRAHLFTQLADITGNAVTEIESIFQVHAAKISSPVLQEAYARFIMSKIFDLLDQSQK